MEFSWRDLLPLLHGIDSRSVFDACSDAILSEVEISNLPDIIHSLVCDYAAVEDIRTRIVTARLIEMLVSKHSTCLSRLIAESESDGELLGFSELDMSTILNCKCTLGKGTDNHAMEHKKELDKSLYTKNWQEKQKRRLQRILGMATESINASFAIMHDETVSDLLVDRFEVCTDSGGERLLSTQPDIPQLFQNVTHSSYEKTSETWFARIVRHLLVSLSDERWYYRDGASRCLHSIIKGLKQTELSSVNLHPFPPFIIDDGLCLGLLVLVIDKFIDFKDLMSLDHRANTMFSKEDWGDMATNAASTMPVKTSMACLIGQCLNALDDVNLLQNLEKVTFFATELIKSRDWTVQFGGVQLLIEVMRLFPYHMVTGVEPQYGLFCSFSNGIRAAAVSEINELSEMSVEMLRMIIDQLQSMDRRTIDTKVLHNILSVMDDVSQQITTIDFIDENSETTAIKILSASIQLVIALLRDCSSNFIERELGKSVIIQSLSSILEMLQKKSVFSKEDIQSILDMIQALNAGWAQLEISASDSIPKLIGLFVVLFARIESLQQRSLIDETMDESKLDEFSFRKKLSPALLENCTVCHQAVLEWHLTEYVLRDTANCLVSLIDQALGSWHVRVSALQQLIEACICTVSKVGDWKKLKIQEISLSDILMDEFSVYESESLSFSGILIYHVVQKAHESLGKTPNIFGEVLIMIHDQIQQELTRFSNNSALTISYVGSSGSKRKFSFFDSAEMVNEKCPVELIGQLVRWFEFAEPQSQSDLSTNVVASIFSSLKELSSCRTSLKRVTRKSSQQTDVLISFESIDLSPGFSFSSLNTQLQNSWQYVRSTIFIICYQYISGKELLETTMNRLLNGWRVLLSTGDEVPKFRSIVLQDSMAIYLLLMSMNGNGNDGLSVFDILMDIAGKMSNPDFISILVATIVFHRWSLLFSIKQTLMVEDILKVATKVLGLMLQFANVISIDHESEYLITTMVSEIIGNICRFAPTVIVNLGRWFESFLFSSFALSECNVEPSGIKVLVAKLFQKICVVIPSLIACSGYDLWIHVAIRGIAHHEASIRSNCVQSFRILVTFAPLAMKQYAQRDGFNNNGSGKVLMEELFTKSKDFSLPKSCHSRDLVVMESFRSFCPQFGPGGRFRIRDYQWEAISWWTLLRRCGLNGVLADDMGLGKTLQALVCLLLMRIEKLLSGNGKNRIDQAVELTPSLVICPAALVYHWTGEIKSYFSDCSLLHEVMICEGNNWKINFNAATTALLIVSYDTLRRNMEFFQSRVWEMIILDEAHLIRNPKTILSKSVFQLKSEYRLALTGTPIQNKVEDIWSLMHFLLPDYLGDFRSFSKEFISPVKKSMTAFQSMKSLAANSSASSGSVRDFKKQAKVSAEGLRQLKQLHKLILPFILRRTKEKVLCELPPKTIIDVVSKLSPTQKSMYSSFMQQIAQTWTEQSLMTKINGDLEGIAGIEQDGINDTPDESDKEGVELFQTIISNKAENKKSSILKSNPFASGSVKSEQVTSGPINHLTILTSLQLLCAHPGLVVDGRTRSHYRNELVSNIKSSGKFLELMKLMLDSQVIDSSSFCDTEGQFEDFNEFYEFLNQDDIVTTNDCSDDEGESDEMRYRVRTNESLAVIDSDSDTEEIDSGEDGEANEPSKTAYQATVSVAKKCLIFAKHQTVLDLLEKCILKRFFPTVSYARLDGHVSPESRYRISQQFQQGNSNVDSSFQDQGNSFGSLKSALPSGVRSDESSSPSQDSIQILLLTTRSSGLGLNLSAADTVIFVENDFNPFIDQQAMDRVHRIGQRNPVTIYRLLADSTIESRIMTLQQFKRNVSDQVIHGGEESDSPQSTESTSGNNQDMQGKPSSGIGRMVWDSLVERCRN